MEERKMYNVSGKTCAGDNFTVNTDNYKRASDLYAMMYDSDEYVSGYVVSGETGEVFAHFHKAETKYSVEMHAYCQKEWE